MFKVAKISRKEVVIERLVIIVIFRQGLGGGGVKYVKSSYVAKGTASSDFMIG